MNRYAEIAMRVAGDVDDAVAVMMEYATTHFGGSRKEVNIGTDWGALEVIQKQEKVEGDKATFDVVFYAPKLSYLEWTSYRKVENMDDATLIKAFQTVVGNLKNSIVNDIKNHMRNDPRFYLVVDHDKKDDYEGVTGNVQDVQFGNFRKTKWDIFVDGKIRVTIEATKLPELATGVYSQMRDSELKRWIQVWANYAPEEFWMDGEYRGTAAARIRGLMQRWRGMTPNQQNKHFAEIQKMR